jgi:N-hydroxyarylamine O-acetyltransferase
MSSEPLVGLDLPAYLERISYSGPCVPGAPALEALHLAHATHIPFENLDIQLGRPIRLDLESLQAKLVRGRRGGYCFEHNTLFAAMLERVGFRLNRLAARVRRGASRILPRTHMLLEVEADGRPWLADAGFGGEGLLKPLPLVPGQVFEVYGWHYRLQEQSGLWTLQCLRRGEWLDLYAFTREPHFDADFEMANYYVSTHPASRFVQTLTAQLATPEAHYILRDRELLVLRGDEETSKAIADEEGLLRLLVETFGLHFPAGTRFRRPVFDEPHPGAAG